MLPLYGLAIVAAHQGDPSAFTAETIVIAQAVMVVAAMLANRLIRWRGYWWVILLTFLALPVRGLIAASLMQAWGVWPEQALDGVGAGLQSVAVPALVVRLLNGYRARQCRARRCDDSAGGRRRVESCARRFARSSLWLSRGLHRTRCDFDRFAGAVALLRRRAQTRVPYARRPGSRCGGLDAFRVLTAALIDLRKSCL